MMGLAYIAAFAVYLLLSVIVVKFTLNWARNHNKNAKVWGIVVGLVMYNLVFWDFLPTLALHKYYCATESGFWVYKTAEQWRAEHPDVVVGPVKAPPGELKFNSDGLYAMYTLPDGTTGSYNPTAKTLNFNRPGGSLGYWLNDRFYNESRTVSFPVLTLRNTVESIIDGQSGEQLFKLVSFSAGSSQSLKMWTHYYPCEVSYKEIGSIMKSYQYIDKK